MGRPSISLRRSALLGLMAVGAAACASVLGIEDRGLDPTLDGSTQEGSTPDGGTSDGHGGSDSTSPDAPGVDGPGAESGVDAPGVDAPQPDGPTCADPCLLASGLDHPFLMTADGTSVYWTEFGDDLGSSNGAVKGCPVSGCGPGPTIYAQGLTNPRGLAVDATHIYFGTATYGGVTGGIWSCPLSGCAGSPTPLAPASIPFGVAVDGTSVYWVDYDDGTVRKVGKGGGSAALLYDGGPYDDAGNTLSELGQLIVDGPYLFFGDYSEDVYRLPIGGPTPVLLANTVNGGAYGSYFGITSDTNNVYSGGNGIIVGVNKLTSDGGSAVATGVSSALGLAFDPATGLLYWANFGTGGGNDGTIGKFGNDGGAKQVMQASLVTPEAIAIGGGYAFWLSSGTLGGASGTNVNTGALWRTAK